jgi:hypothetical protein
MRFDFPEKQKYRETVWTLAERRLRRPRALTRVAYLESGEALETRFLLDRGYRAANLLAVNRSAALLATATRRLREWKLAEPHRQAGEWSEVASAYSRLEALDVLHFDTCSPVTAATIFQIVVPTIVRKPRILIANVLAGRESRESTEQREFTVGEYYGEHRGERRSATGEELIPSHLDRMRHVAMRLGRIGVEHGLRCDRWQYGSYVSESGQAMVWGVFAMRWK